MVREEMKLLVAAERVNGPEMQSVFQVASQEQLVGQLEEVVLAELEEVKFAIWGQLALEGVKMVDLIEAEIRAVFEELAGSVVQADFEMKELWVVRDGVLGEEGGWVQVPSVVLLVRRARMAVVESVPRDEWE